MPVTFAVSVTPTFTGRPTPTGTITLKDGATTLATLSLQQGRARFVTSNLSQGTHIISTTYSGDRHFNPNAAPSITQIVNP